MNTTEHTRVDRNKRSIIWLTACVLLVISTDPAHAESDTLFERWYVVTIGQQRVGWLHTTVSSRDTPPLLTTETELRLRIKRGAFQVDMRMVSQFVETPEGTPVEASSTQMLGLIESSRRIRFKEDGLEVETIEGGMRRVTHAETPRVADDLGVGQLGWLPPEALHRYVADRISEGADKIESWTVDPLLGLEPVGTTAVLRGTQNIEVFGRTLPAIAWDVSLSTMPGLVTREYVDPQGRVVKSAINLGPGLQLTVLEADPALAQAKVDPPELMASTLIDPGTTIQNPRSLRRAEYVVRYTNTDDDAKKAHPASLELPSAGYQRARTDDGHCVHVNVDLDRPVTTSPAPDLGPYLAASAILNHTDPAIRKLTNRAREAVPHGASAADTARALSRFVHRFVITKDLAVGLATAGEVARTAQGDCTEHAVLLAAMLRAAGIPSRTVTGLVYIDRFLGRKSVFGYHMWAQAWIADDHGDGGRWLDLDPTLVEAGFDAAHIALRVNALDGDALINDLMTVAPLIGRLSIKIIVDDNT